MAQRLVRAGVSSFMGGVATHAGEGEVLGTLLAQNVGGYGAVLESLSTLRWIQRGTTYEVDLAAAEYPAA